MKIVLALLTLTFSMSTLASATYSEMACDLKSPNQHFAMSYTASEMVVRMNPSTGEAEVEFTDSDNLVGKFKATYTRTKSTMTITSSQDSRVINLTEKVFTAKEGAFRAVAKDGPFTALGGPIYFKGSGVTAQGYWYDAMCYSKDQQY